MKTWAKPTVLHGINQQPKSNNQNHRVSDIPNNYKAKHLPTNMKKSVAFLAVFLLLFTTALVHAAEDNETITDESTYKEKIDAAFECLEDKADDCSDLTTQEVALTIMASPDNIFDDCVQELLDRQKNDHWGNIRDTALAILALDHAGEDTESAEEWLIEENRTPTDLIWYLQEDSNEQTECHIGYDAKDYTITIGEDKKINADAGSCLTKAQANFWLQIDSDCYSEKFSIECDQDFIANLIYRNKDSSTIYVLEGTQSAPAYDTIELEVNSKCFGDSSCDYESTVWAAAALAQTNHDIDEYIPYIVAMSDTNTRYLPDAFIYMLTNYEDYASSLIEDQKLGDYWEAKSTSYSKYYDTALAILALEGSNSEQVENARDWLLFAQASNGCWQNKVRETAMALWALEGRAGRAGSGTGGGVTYCSDAGFFCIASQECTGSDDIGENYFCPSLSDTCCKTENLKVCSEYSGEVCASNEVCTGNSRKSLDVEECCTGSCQPRPTTSECEENYYTCMDSCSEFQEPISAYACDGAQVCCRTKTTTASSGSSWWIWVLLILIIAVLAAIGYIYREQLKLYWFQLKTKFKKDKDEDKGTSFNSGTGPSFPPKPGFPPIRRQPMPPRPQPRKSFDRRDPAMAETFRKLKEMSR